MYPGRTPHSLACVASMQTFRGPNKDFPSYFEEEKNRKKNAAMILAAIVVMQIPIIDGRGTPTIINQAIDHILAVGESANLVVSARGEGTISYQWRLDGSDLPGENIRYLQIVHAVPEDAGTYTAIVTDDTGSVESDPYQVTVNTDWKIYQNERGELIIPYNGIVDLEIDSDGDAWIATGRWYTHAGNGLARYNGRSWTFYNTQNSPMPDYDCTGMTLGPEGDIWVSTEIGIVQFDRVDEWHVYYPQNHGMPTNQTWFPKFDLDGRLWVGSSAGLLSYDGATWTRYNQSNSGLPNNFVNDIGVDSENRKWIGTQNGLAVFDGDNWIVYNTSNSGLPGNIAGCIRFDSMGTAWIGTFGGGLALFDGEFWEVYHSGNSGLPGDNVTDILLPPDNVGWISTQSGIASFDGEEWISLDEDNSPIPENNVQCLALDSYGNLWMGTAFSGIGIYREGGVISTVQIMSLYPQGDQTMTLEWTGGIGPFQVQFRNSLHDGTWLNLESTTERRYTIPDGNDRMGFFRIVENPALSPE